MAALRGMEKQLSNQKVIDALNLLVNIHNQTSKSIVINLLKTAGNPSSKPYLEDALKKTNDDDLKKRIQEALDAIK